ncbi:MAG: aminotransferase class V-fold PLP-dependent enzyme, partial [Thermoplasmatales archaeon]|nr:aminotransferase class V-fold PLP-dependent enzyme [Thermoplasmatales archaeon]
MPGSEVIGKEEQEAVNEVFEKGGVLSRYGNDARRQNIFRVVKFEEEFAKKLNVKYAYAVSSGTAALKAVLEAFGVGPGDEVITQSHTFIATVEAIIETGATPVIADINKTLNMDPDDFGSKITPRTKAV